MNETDFSTIDSLRKSVKRYSTTIIVIDIILVLAIIVYGLGIYFNIFLLHAIPFSMIILGLPINGIIARERNQKQDLLTIENHKKILETFEKIKEAKIR